MNAERIKALEEALRALELANDRLCGARPQQVYDLMIASGMADVMLELDRARATAIALLAASKPAPDCHQPDLVTADSSQPAQPVAVTWPARCDGVEQDAFEAWAKDNHYDMELHPLHWLFLNARTSAARDGWAAGLAHAVDRMRAALDVQPLTVQDAARWQEVASKIWQIANCTDPEDPEFIAALRAISEGRA